MKLTERLAAIADALPETAAVTLPVAELRRWLTDESAAPIASTESATAEDRWLTAEEVAKRLKVSRRYVYAHRRDYPFARELDTGTSRNTVRFSERGLERFMARAQAKHTGTIA